MKGRTLTRADLAEAVYQEVGLSRSESAGLVDSILTEIGDSLLADAAAAGRFQPGQLLLLNAMGGGFTWGAALVRW